MKESLLERLVTWFINAITVSLAAVILVVVALYSLNDVRGEGYRAGKSGVPAVANPYIRDPYSSSRWLEGWIQSGAGWMAGYSESEPVRSGK
jgi:hypothetical protein